MPGAFEQLNQRIADCKRCGRLVAHCRKTAAEKRAAYRDETYWGKPVPNFGPAKRAGRAAEQARLVIVGLAPGAHGANRTGRMFTGDKSGDFLFGSLAACGFANQPQATRIGDGLELIDCVITAAAHCAPPDNKPTREEFANCLPYLIETLSMMDQLKVCVCLGGLAHAALLRAGRKLDWPIPRPQPRFGHAAEHPLGNGITILDCYHPSQQNTFTGRLTRPMMDAVFRRAKKRCISA